ncbi:diguanylate cyclase domain-containing protein [Sphaerotilus mobilis]|uniref:diguanylate cyclase n=1 Tax=Sphaerotilus mobilis TaxID=47994 RepID=A0A4Q7LPY0_9BURK|nr:diguanylate cyclase [Sphaerotilus mobilis]RZS56614.1 diguanylate cyclase (GGDEF)-like protein [Sphaerotilus mobilis]
MPNAETQLRHLAATMVDLSGLRERGALEERLIAGLAEMLSARSVALWIRDVDMKVDMKVDVKVDIQAAPGDETLPTPGWRLARAVSAGALPVPDRVRNRLRDWVAHAERGAQPAEHPGLWVLPLLHGHTPVALVEIEREPPVDAAERARTEQLLRLYGNLRRLLDDNECDELTGLLNRKTFDESFMRLGPLRQVEPVELLPLLEDGDDDERRSRPAGEQSWLAVVDVDHFKRVNDRYGHLVGDEVLLLLSQLMRDTFRQSDRLYRFGGEEFVVLLRCPDGQGARAALERLRRRVAERDFPQVGQLTISIGYTHIDADDTPESAFGRADQAVYHAKQAGRNQVHEHAELVALGKLNAPEPVSSGVDFF